MSSSSSGSSDEYYGGRRNHHHHNHGSRPRPPRPPPRAARCGDGWKSFTRPQGVWCIKVGPSNSDYFGAMSRCTAHGAVLTGLQSNEERVWIDQEVNRQTMTSTIRDAGTWLGAQKIAGTNQFQWTDGHTTGLVTMGWGPKQPDNSNMRGRGSQDCVHIISLNTGYTRGWTFLGFVTGQLDDINCGYNDDPSQNFYACGKKPS